MTNVSNVGNDALAHILGKTRDAAAGGITVLSTGEALAAALVLNRADWIADRGYTIAEALERIGPEWVRLIPAAAKQFRREIDLAEEQKAQAAHIARLAAFTARPDAEKDATLEFTATFVTSGSAPGYRDVHLTFDLRPVGVGSESRTRVKLRLRPEDGATVVGEITDVHRFAWRNDAPIDAKTGEARPRWIDGR
jgi:hypothetical protein